MEMLGVVAKGLGYDGFATRDTGEAEWLRLLDNDTHVWWRPFTQDADSARLRNQLSIELNYYTGAVHGHCAKGVCPDGTPKWFRVEYTNPDGLDKAVREVTMRCAADYFING
jgi:hypothetical protein